jgi:K+-sensing histidine kinase KdpD
MDQLQTSLDESESLYNTSRRLAMATNLQEMVSSITEGLRISDINRAEIMLFETDPSGQIVNLRVAANWYSGWGTLPLSNNSIFPRSTFASFTKILSPIPLFIDDLRNESQIANSKQAIIDLSKTASTAIIPLWVGKRQLGIMLLLAEVKHQFSDREMRSYPPLIGQLATAIENLRLFEQTQAALAETEELYQASTDLNTAKTNEEILDTLHTYTILGQGSHNLNLALFNQMWSGNEVPEVAHIIARKSILSESIISEEYTLRAFPSVFKLLHSNEPTIVEDIALSTDIDENWQLALWSSLFTCFLIAHCPLSSLELPLSIPGGLSWLWPYFSSSHASPYSWVSSIWVECRLLS